MRSDELRELSELVVLHARATGMSPRHCRRVLSRVGPDSWAEVWSAEARRHEARGAHLAACRHYNLARFPFVDGPEREKAAAASVDAFDRWRRARGGIDRLEFDIGGRVVCWVSAPDPRPRPLLIVTGGIVSAKEQWAPILARARALGATIAVTEMPGVGENALRYDAASPRLFTELIDRLSTRADAARTHLVALSFSGHLAIRAALDDARVRAITTVGAPIRHTFAPDHWPRLPRTTVRTLAHLTGLPEERLAAAVQDWALTPGELDRLGIPLYYAAARHDEIIPAARETALLARHVRGLRLIEFDDVHGAPDHLPLTRLWTVLSTWHSRPGPRRRPARALLPLLEHRHRPAPPGGLR
ncbi:hypothetical protein GCM10023085_31570 [Actinomadura viridis]|uniref:Alpha/beta hydrolase n=1 Tax=Actinomadura viridis TaxID=58110 RepID=A0A931GNX7_9ACTN|nr:alpha/beta hydrolase [Actinomadura viridis]MBG6086839.1 hypothetical protein [Actinomadura viridis]